MGVICVQPLVKEADIKSFNDKEPCGLFKYGEYVTSDDDITLNNLFTDIVHYISSQLSSELLSIECLVLELVMSYDSKSISLRKDECKPCNSLNFISLNLDAEYVEILEEKFFELHTYTQKFIQVWNKARFFFTPNNSGYFFEYKFDSDLCWAQSIDPESIEYQKLPPDVENEIMNWEGLSKSHFKPWIN